MSSWNEAYALCPFYKADDKKTITCEALFKAESNLNHKFLSCTQKNNHIQKHCNSNYKSCPYYKALQRIKYHSVN